MYTVTHQGTITNAGGDNDLIEILPADDKPVKLRGMVLSQISEVGDAAEEGLRISIIRMTATVTSGSGGSTPTPVPMDSANTAAGFSVETGNTTVATTSGSTLQFAEYGWNIRNTPFSEFWPEEMSCKAKQGEGLLVRLQTTAADDFTGAFTFWVEEE
jgi:hypothetical protein